MNVDTSDYGSSRFRSYVLEPGGRWIVFWSESAGAALMAALRFQEHLGGTFSVVVDVPDLGLKRFGRMLA